MATFGQLKLTNLGIQAQIDLQNGVPLTFTKIGIGSGEYFGNTSSLTKLVKQEVLVDISRAYTKDNTYVVMGNFTNEKLQTGFEWREVGLYFEDKNGNDVLYCYANAGDKYDYIPSTADERYTKTVRITTAVSNSANVSFKEGTFIYVEKKDFDAYVADATAEHVGIREEIAVERARIDLFTTLAEGSTIGDAELMDIRVGANGVTYGSAGAAVRGQAKQLSNAIEDLIDGNEKIETEWVSGFVSTTGDIEANANVITQAELQRITAGESIELQIEDGYSYAISWYNSTGALARRAGSWLTAASVITNSYTYYRLSILKNGGITTDESKAVTVRKLGRYMDRETAVTKITENEFGVSKLNKIADVIGECASYLYQTCICIGDSLTRGYYSETVDNGDGALPTYPKALAKLTGWNVTQAGRSGASAKSWYEERINLFDYSDKDVAIIYLGTNEGLEAYSATDTTSTQVGCYRKIIQRVLSENPACKIFLCTVSGASGSTVDITNDSIRKLAEEFKNCYVLELKDNGMVDLAMDELHPYDYIHMTAIGYITQARVIYNLIKGVISANISDFDIVE